MPRSCALTARKYPPMPKRITYIKDDHWKRLQSEVIRELPYVLLPATTALGSIHPIGREMGILAGANVVMPNLSPTGVRDKYMLYDGKICTGDAASECRHCMERRMGMAGYEVVISRGDVAQL